MIRLAALLCTGLALAPALPAAAEVSLSDLEAVMPGLGADFKPTPDFELLLTRIGDKPELRRQVQMILQMRGVGGSRDITELLRGRLLGELPGLRDGSFTRPYRYRAAAQVQMAQMRGRAWAQLLSADLNNDGQITKQEVKDTLEFFPAQGASDAFFTSDANDDSVLSPEELRAAVDRQMETGNGGYGRRVNSSMAELFDFDDDGSLTPAEFERGLIALGVSKL